MPHRALLFLTFLLCTLTHSSLYAYSAIVSIPDQGAEIFSYAANFRKQADADAAALQRCKSSAKKNGLGKLAVQCKIYARGQEPGFGAVSCGDDGCGWAVGRTTIQEAENAAYEACSKDIKNCASKDLKSWSDFAGFNEPKAAPPASSSGNCIPNTPVRRCSSQCTNGNCLVTYENGCKVRVQVSPRFDPFSNQWQYPSPGC